MNEIKKKIETKTDDSVKQTDKLSKNFLNAYHTHSKKKVSKQIKTKKGSVRLCCIKIKIWEENNDESTHTERQQQQQQKSERKEIYYVDTEAVTHSESVIFS